MTADLERRISRLEAVQGNADATDEWIEHEFSEELKAILREIYEGLHPPDAIERMVNKKWRGPRAEPELSPAVRELIAEARVGLRDEFR